MASKKFFRIGKVRGDLRGKNWSLTYHEHGRRIRPRVGPDWVLDTCDDWQLPLFAMLMMTGLRPGELTHLVLPDDLDLENGVLRVRNKPELGWQVKTRTEREIPLLPPLIELLRAMLAGRTSGIVFRRRRFSEPDFKETRLASVEHMHEEKASNHAEIVTKSFSALFVGRDDASESLKQHQRLRRGPAADRRGQPGQPAVDDRV